MKVLYSWLKEYVDIPWGPDSLAERLTMAGLEVEEVKEWSPTNEKIRIGKIVSVLNHPNSDHLFICKTDVGDRILTIVCGAPNTVANVLVPVALPGAVLANIKGEIKQAVIRGVPSEGIICSAWELGISDDHSGIMILPNNLTAGNPFHFSKQETDAVLDVFITPNRGDCLSIVGIAREVAALSNGSIRLPEISLHESTESAASQVSVEVIDTHGCPRYSAKIIRDITIGSSPQWIIDRLEACGVRAINNIVDITNYILLEIGQPLHAFDFERIKSKRIVVRSAKKDETFITLDNVLHNLQEVNLLICDGDEPVALAGVMGGANSEVLPETQNILLESAFFNQKRIRQSSCTTGLSTEASRRFERGVDPERVIWANNRAAAMMQEIAGGKVQQGIIDVNTFPEHKNTVMFRPNRCNQILGTRIRKQDMISVLKGLECQVEENSMSLEVTVPRHRWDLTREIDLIEEIARIRGFHTIPAKTQSTINLNQVQIFSHDRAINYLKETMIGLGFFEVINNDMTGKRTLNFLTGDNKPLKLTNPLNEDLTYLRTSLIPSLIETLEWNKNHGTDTIHIFEIGKIFFETGLSTFTETLSMGGLMAGESDLRHWSRPRVLIEFYDVKGIVETILRKIFLDSFEFIPYDTMNLEDAYEILISEEKIGYFGRLKDSLFEVPGKTPAYVFEFKLDTIIQNLLQRIPKYKPISRFPFIKRDLVLLVDRDLPAGKLLQNIYDSAGKLLKDIKIFDLYQGKQIPENKKSIGFSLIFGSDDQTLLETEVNIVIEQILRHVEITCQAVLRPF